VNVTSRLLIVCSPWQPPEQRWGLLQVHIDELNIAEVQAEYEGPGGGAGLPVCCSPYPYSSAQHSGHNRVSALCAAGTPYEGGLFRMKLVVGTDFPNVPPKGGCDSNWRLCCCGQLVCCASLCAVSSKGLSA